MDSLSFSPIQLDALREVSNIGAGNAATSLSMMLNSKVDMSVPAVNMVGFETLYDLEIDKEVYGIIVRVIGDIPGNILIIFERSTAHEIIAKLTGQPDDELTEFGRSVLCEMGNIISAGYMNSMAEFTGLKITPSVPAVAHDMLSAMLSTVFVESGQHDEYILDIETIFKKDSENDLGVHFYYIPVPGSLEKILKTIGVN